MGAFAKRAALPARIMGPRSPLRSTMRSLLSPLCLALTPCLAAQSPARHSLQVTLLPDDQRIEVTDRIEIPSDWEPVATQDGSGPVWSFTLNPALQVEASTPAVVRKPVT